MQTGAASVETVWNFLTKLKMELPFVPAISLPCLCPKNPETLIQKNYELPHWTTPMFTAAQFTIAKCWKQPRCPSVNDQKAMVHLHNGILCSRKKEGALTLHDNMNGTGKYYAKWSKPGCERQIPYDLTYKWNLINKTNWQSKYSQRHWNGQQTDSNQRGGEREITWERRERVVNEHV